MKNKKTLMTTALSVAMFLSLSACSSTVKPETAVTPPVASESASATPVASEPVTPAETPVAPVEPAPAASGTALEALETLTVAPFSSTSKYQRANFGETWEDIDSNGCETREDILKRDIPNATIKGKCDVRKGSFSDPYTGKTINFNADDGKGGGVDIDHIIPLSLGWKTGASEWDAAKRLKFANDPLNLMASDSGENRKKGDKDASAYLPPNKAFHCEYVARQVSVRVKYGTWITPAEKSAIYTVLQSCPTQPLIADTWGISVDKSAPVAPVAPAEPAPAAPVEPAPVAEAPVATGGNDPQFSSCAKAKAEGFGPYTAADPEFSWYRDGDGDGTVCE